ncbi:hypothetical protein AHF37_06120 [Paragonimus kellicotti]|nr:hypothetical protein AHF37_06120 [Paragonimus kellicotti]
MNSPGLRTVHVHFTSVNDQNVYLCYLLDGCRDLTKTTPKRKDCGFTVATWIDRIQELANCFVDSGSS